MRGQLRFKLRFRRGGRQVVRYVRPGDVETVRAELSELQAARQLTKELNEATRLAREALRNTKIQLEPLVNELGFRFHGRAIRRPRKQKTSMDAQP
jgi:hypothetical protein